MVSIEARENPERVPLALSNEAMLRSALFVALALFSLTPWASAPLALVAGIAFALLFATPFAAKVKCARKYGTRKSSNCEALIRIDTGVLHDFSPARCLIPDELSELLWSAADSFGPVLF